MKHIVFFAFALFVAVPGVTAGDKQKKSANAPKETEAAQAKTETPNEIHWLTIDEVQAKMREKPRKVFIDMYTGWCGWCKVMDKKTFSHPAVIKFMNENYYSVKFDAERKDTFRFMSKTYYFDPQKRANTLAAELMRDQLSYPTGIFMEERFMNPIPVPGYQDVKTFEAIVTFISRGLYKSQQWPDFQKNFTPTWEAVPEEVASPNVTSEHPPMVH